MVTQRCFHRKSGKTAKPARPARRVRWTRRGGDASLLKTIAGQASGLLEAWDQYAASLSDGGSQKNAWTQLLGMDDQVRALRGSLGGLGESNPALDNIVNELEIMAATEKFKLNRGDYA